MRVPRAAVRASSLLVAVGLWQLATSTHWNAVVVDFANVPAPTAVVASTWELLHSPKLVHHVQNSVQRVFAGFAAATVLGVGLGLAVGRSKWTRDVAMSPLEVLRPIPAVAWIPLAILMFPSSELSMIFITFTGAFFPILLSTIHGVEGLDERLVFACCSLGANRGQIVREVVVPGAMPSIVTGLSIGMGTAWFCLVTAEMIAGQYGIGYYTWESYNLQRYPEIVVGMLFIGIFGMLSSAMVKRVGSLLTPWYRPEERVG
jgi:NitT/TauT family transport system permease protein